GCRASGCARASRHRSRSSGHLRAELRHLAPSIRHRFEPQREPRRHKRATMRGVPVIRIDADADMRLADYQSIPDPRLATERGLFVAEGRFVVGRLLAGNRLRLRSVMVTAPALDALQPALVARPDL